MSHTSVELRTPFQCAHCLGYFFDYHCCPQMPYGNTAPGTIFIAVPQVQWPARVPTGGEGEQT